MAQEKKLNEVIIAIDPAHTQLTTYDDFDPTEAGAGMEAVRQEDRVTPFLYVLASNSKACTRGAAEYVPGAAAGMFYNNSSKRLYDGEKGIDLVVCHYRKIYIEWVPIDDGGGLVGIWEPDDPIIKKLRSEQGQFTALKVPNGTERYGAEQDTEIVETNEHYALIGEPGFTVENCERVIVPYSSIKLGPFKKEWVNTHESIVLNGRDGPMMPAVYWPRWRVNTVFQQKWKPNGAFNVRFGLVNGNVDKLASLMKANDPVRKMAREFREQVLLGEVKADYSKAQDAAAGEDGIPF